MDSANPLALAATNFGNDGGCSVTLDGHFAYVDTNSQTIYAPTMIRTGTGSIDIAAANDVSLLDMTAPGVIYTAAPLPTARRLEQMLVFSLRLRLDLTPTSWWTNAVNPDGAGDILIHAGNDITGVENVSGSSSTNSQFWCSGWRPAM